MVGIPTWARWHLSGSRCGAGFWSVQSDRTQVEVGAIRQGSLWGSCLRCRFNRCWSPGRALGPVSSITGAMSPLPSVSPASELVPLWGAMAPSGVLVPGPVRESMPPSESLMLGARLEWPSCCEVSGGCIVSHSAGSLYKSWDVVSLSIH